MSKGFLTQEIIRQKRDGAVLDKSAIAAFVAGITSGAVSEGQIAAFAMATFFQGMAAEEIVALTLAMRSSGQVLAWPTLDKPIVDKHSTGGVGDNVSLMLAPIVAACGAAVPMISGRGLGHTGGTLDKMDAIPGYQSQPDESLFRQVVGDVGCAIIGQTADLAPADKRFYAIRDVTATVESIPLITASILSKKLAAGLESLVLDVKFGNGAFMRDEDNAKALARSLVEVANNAGLKASALLTDMNEPLADCAGNAIEVQSAVDFLAGTHQPARLRKVTLALAAEMLVAAGLAPTAQQGHAMAGHALDSGQALQHFDQMVRALGGPADFTAKAKEHLPQAAIIRPILAKNDGTLTAWDARALGLIVVGLGGGRRRPEDVIDPRVGLSQIAPIGTKLTKGQPLAMVHGQSVEDCEAAEDALLKALTLSDHAAAESPLIAAIIAPKPD